MKKHTSLLLTLSLFTIFSAKSQDTIYYDTKGEKVATKELAKEFKIVTYGEQKGIEATERTYTSSGEIKAESFYTDYEDKIRVGLKTTWYDNGKIRTETNYHKGKWHGDYISYWPNGSMRRKDHYKKGDFKNGKVWDSTGVQVEFYPMMERPQFPGGQEALAKFLKANVKNPNKKRGRILVKFVIDKTGEVIRTEIMKSDLPELNEEALRIVASMPRWTPGKHEGEPVKVFFALPLVFQ